MLILSGGKEILKSFYAIVDNHEIALNLGVRNHPPEECLVPRIIFG